MTTWTTGPPQGEARSIPVFGKCYGITILIKMQNSCLQNKCLYERLKVLLYWIFINTYFSFGDSMHPTR
jgi:hypothetical protein